MKSFAIFAALLGAASADRLPWDKPPLIMPYQERDQPAVGLKCVQWNVKIETLDLKDEAWPFCAHWKPDEAHTQRYTLYGGRIGKDGHTGRCHDWLLTFDEQDTKVKVSCRKGEDGERDRRDRDSGPFGFDDDQTPLVWKVRRQDSEDYSIEEGRAAGNVVSDPSTKVKRDHQSAAPSKARIITAQSTTVHWPSSTGGKHALYPSEGQDYSSKIASMLKVAGRQKKINKRAGTVPPPNPYDTDSNTTALTSYHDSPPKTSYNDGPSKTSYNASPSKTSHNNGGNTPVTHDGGNSTSSADIGKYDPKQLVNMIAPLRKKVEQTEAELRYAKGQLRALDPSNPLAADGSATSSPFSEVKPDGQDRTNTTTIITSQSQPSTPEEDADVGPNSSPEESAEQDPPPSSIPSKRQFPNGPAPDRPSSDLSIEALCAKIIQLQSELDAYRTTLKSYRNIQKAQREDPRQAEIALGYGMGDTMTPERPHEPPSELQSTQGHTVVNGVPRGSHTKRKNLLPPVQLNEEARAAAEKKKKKAEADEIRGLDEEERPHQVLGEREAVEEKEEKLEKRQGAEGQPFGGRGRGGNPYKCPDTIIPACEIGNRVLNEDW